MISRNNNPNETQNLDDDPDDLKKRYVCLQKSTTEDRNVSPTYCQRDWDHILCWPPTAPGTFSTQNCFEEFNHIRYDPSDNVSRWCNENGRWNKTTYGSCKELEHFDWSDKIFLCGFVVSLMALAVAVVIFLCYRELRCLRNAIHTNLMCTYMLFAIAWLVLWIIQPDQLQWRCPEWLCNTFLFILNFATLTNFFWMFVEGLYLYMLVVRTFTIENIKLRVYLLIGWGIPVPIIVTWAFWKAHIIRNLKNWCSFYLSRNWRLTLKLEDSSDAEEGCTWVKDTDADWVFKTPPFVILVINCGFLGRIMWVLITKLRSANTAETQQYRKATRALLVLFPLLGITYLMGFYVPDYGKWTTIIRYVRDLLIGFQGLVVSILYCFFNSEVRSVLRHSFRVFCEQRQIGSKRHRFACSRESPYVGSENVRLFGNPDGTGQARYVKRESGASDMTTVTYVGYSSSANGRCRSLSGSAAATAGSVKAAMLATSAPSSNCV